MKFDKAVSLGLNCQCRYNISRILLNRTKLKKDNVSTKDPYDYGTHFFDWSVSPLDSVIKILNSDFQNTFMLENLKLVPLNENEQTVLDQGSGCEYPHIFEKTKFGNCSRKDLERDFEKAKQKIDPLVDKTKALLSSNERALFVVTGNSKAQDLLNLNSAIENYRDSNYMILHTTWKNKFGFEDSFRVENERFIVKPITHTPYPGDFNSWDEAFSDIDLELPLDKNPLRVTLAWLRKIALRG
ncbi:DUF1796 family putative cysteine peptidase [Glaciecola sp. 1036]|uniref:DUF1796 family putative cysteine peptidase n=1 Tax=Alteromonadaceae TaxID=72275 RepID=UPI003CFCAE08